MSEIQERVQRHIDMLVDTGAETGLQVTVYQDGALIVDAVAGTADLVTGRLVADCLSLSLTSIGASGHRYSRPAGAAVVAVRLCCQAIPDDLLVTNSWQPSLRRLRTRSGGMPEID